MEITDRWLKENNACQGARDWVRGEKNRDANRLIQRCLKLGGDHLFWAVWGIPRLLSLKNCVKYAVYAAELALPIYEKKYPNDKRPRQAIEAAKSSAMGDTIDVRRAAEVTDDATVWAQAKAAEAAACAAYAATAAAAKAQAKAAAWAAEAAAKAQAKAAAWAAEAAACAAWAAEAPAKAAEAKEKIQRQIINYGLGLLTKK